MNASQHPLNERLQDYLRFYVDLPGAPGFAVFINGAWGAGKTWFINKFREKDADHKYIYVSLYGVSSTAEIEDQFFQQLHPLLASKPFAIGSKLVKGFLKGAINFDFDGDKKDDVRVDVKLPDEVKIQEFLKDSAGRILIFDDLERCNIKPEEILGYINHFVEHQGQKVIILGNEAEIAQSDEYLKKNEKVIGRRFSIHSEIEQAFGSFVAQIRDRNLQQILTEKIGLILSIYDKSKYQNLRTLKHSILEYERFFSMLPSKAQTEKDFQLDCIRSFFSICIELRSGQLRANRIKELTTQFQQARLDKALKREASLASSEVVRFFETHFESSGQTITPNEESLYWFFEFGSVPEHVMKDAIENSRFFLDQATPTWVKLWHIYGVSDDQLQKYFDEVWSDFRNGKFLVHGEIRHVVGICLFYSKNSIVPLTYGRCVTQIRATIRELISSNKIEPLLVEEHWFPRFDDSYRGLCFIEREGEIFREVSKQLSSYQQRRKSEAIASEASNLLLQMKDDPKGFWERVTSSSKENLPLNNVPVFLNINVIDFVDTYLAMEANQRMNVWYAFKQRYEQVRSYPPLTEELKWLRKLRTHIKSRLNGVRQPSKYSLIQFVENYLTPAITMVEEAKNQRTDTRGSRGRKKPKQTS